MLVDAMSQCPPGYLAPLLGRITLLMWLSG